VDRQDSGTLVACLAIPEGVPDADREQLADALRSPLRAGVELRRGDTRWFEVGSPTRRAALPFWTGAAPTLLRTAVPMVLDVNGGPRRERWTLDDAVVCSIGFAMRGVLERDGFAWGSGWAFRSELVRRLREEHGVGARTARVRSNALRFAHRVRDNDLVVATHALVDLGTLAPPGGAGFLALGRARHLGGGLLIPAVAPS
jgi:CRISPR-associated protein Csb2